MREQASCLKYIVNKWIRDIQSTAKYMLFAVLTLAATVICKEAIRPMFAF